MLFVVVVVVGNVPRFFFPFFYIVSLSRYGTSCIYSACHSEWYRERALSLSFNKEKQNFILANFCSNSNSNSFIVAVFFLNLFVPLQGIWKTRLSMYRFVSIRWLVVFRFRFYF